MRLAKLRWRAGGMGLAVLPSGSRWTVTNMGTTKCLKEVECRDLDEVEAVLDGGQTGRRATAACCCQGIGKGETCAT